jgi:hypothetical protein
VKKSLQTDFHARHPGESRGPVRLSDWFNGYQKKVMDSGVRRNEREAWPRATTWEDVYPALSASMAINSEASSL